MIMYNRGLRFKPDLDPQIMSIPGEERVTGKNGSVKESRLLQNILWVRSIRSGGYQSRPRNQSRQECMILAQVNTRGKSIPWVMIHTPNNHTRFASVQPPQIFEPV